MTAILKFDFNAVTCFVILAFSGLTSLRAQDFDGTTKPSELSENSTAALPDLRPCSFKQVTPGETQLAEVLERLGQPAEEHEASGERILTFLHEPFAKVEVFLSRDVVTSIVLHLKESASPRQIARELSVEGFEATSIFNESGKLLGRAYPERGVLLNFATDSSASKVSELLLEPIGAELFVLRAKQDTRHRYSQTLADLEVALQFDPSNAEALYHQAKIRSVAGQLEKSLESIEQALQLAPAEPTYELQKVEILALLERHDDALRLAKKLVADESLNGLLQARAKSLLGELIAMGPARNYVEGVNHQIAAIKLASPLASDRDISIRREAKEVLFNAFLTAARCISVGKWQQREESAAKWLAGARELADAAMMNEGCDENMKLRVHLAIIAAGADMQTETDPAQLLASIDREIKRLNDASGDTLFQQQLAIWQARALLDAASIEHGRDAKLKAFDYATQAAELIDPIKGEREFSPGEKYLVGRLYFFVGSSHAVVHSNHVEAVRWYERARDYLTDTLPVSASADLGRHGERLVSMGASYWEAGEQKEGLELTRRGLELMKQANKQGLLGEDKLALPYGNLAAMYKSMGKSEEAKSFAEIAGRLEVNSASERTRR